MRALDIYKALVPSSDTSYGPKLPEHANPPLWRLRLFSVGDFDCLTSSFLGWHAWDIFSDLLLTHKIGYGNNLPLLIAYSLVDLWMITTIMTPHIAHFMKISFSWYLSFLSDTFPDDLWAQFYFIAHSPGYGKNLQTIEATLFIVGSVANTL